MGIFNGYLLITDMDGTLIDDDRNISEENIEAIKGFISEGGKFTIATGRTVESAKSYIDRYFKDIEIGAPVALYNGSKIYDFNNHKTIWETFLSKHNIDTIKRLKRDYPNLGLEIYCNDGIYIYSECRFTERYKKLNYNVCYDWNDNFLDKQILKALIVGEKDELDKLEEKSADIYVNNNMIRSAKNYLEMVPDGTSKGVQIEEICKLCRFDINKTIALGDEMNDLEMINTCRYGFAVANSNEKLLKSAKHITVSNNEHAIKHVIDIVRKDINNC